jgi:ribose transport system permease protein
MNVLRLLRRYPWIWPILASAVLFALILLLSPVLRFGIFTANLAAASFLALVGIGQMFPIASGEGGIDLSIPFVMNFCAFLAVKTVDDTAASIFLAIGLGMLFGMAVGFVNGNVITRLRIPPIIATLAVGYIVLTIVQIMSATGETRFTDRSFTNFMRSNVLGVPTSFLIVLIVAAVGSFFIRRTVFGRSLLAVGQSRRAADLAGIHVDRTILLAYVVSGALAGMTGTLLAASVGSADLELGNPYLLASVGAVVLGGNSIAGGSATLIGTISGAILLTLLVAATTVAGLPLEFQNVARGIVITLVLVFANVPGSTRRLSWSAWVRVPPADQPAKSRTS